jgi:hypothetical protein
MAKYSNIANVSLSVAVWLAHDEYDYNDDPNTLSVTSLIKPIREIVLSRRIQIDDDFEPDPIEVIGQVASSMGTAFHESIERSWRSPKLVETLVLLGTPRSVAKRIVINPTDEMMADNPRIIPVYMEQRASKKVGKYTISGKFDFIKAGRLEDFKSTSTFTYVNKTNDNKFKLQGSLYRWLNPDKITEDFMAIQFIFTDWQAARAKSDPKYPQTRVLEYPIELHSVMKTDRYVKARLKQMDDLATTDQEFLPDCTPEELWQKDPVFKYYKNPATALKGGRSTKNFMTLLEANQLKAKNGGVGVVKTVFGEAKACNYCKACSICEQRDRLIEEGILCITV